MERRWGLGIKELTRITAELCCVMLVFVGICRGSCRKRRCMWGAQRCKPRARPPPGVDEQRRETMRTKAFLSIWVGLSLACTAEDKAGASSGSGSVGDASSDTEAEDSHSSTNTEGDTTTADSASTGGEEGTDSDAMT